MKTSTVIFKSTRRFNWWFCAPAKLIGVLFIMTCTCLSAQYPWVHQQSPVSSDLTSVCFVDDKNGYIASGEGEILQTKNGGLRWEKIAEFPNFMPTSISFVSPEHGWVAGNYDHIVDSAGVFETLDSGKTWIQRFHHLHYNFNEIQFLNDSVGWMAGCEISASDTLSAIMYTTTSGFSWTLAPGPRVQNALYGIHIRDEDNGIAFGDHGLFFHTTNGGIYPDGSWAMNIAIPTYGKALYGAASSGATYGCVVGQDGFILVTNNKWVSYPDYAITSQDTLFSVTGYSGIPQFYAVGNNGCIASIRYGLFMWMISEETGVTSENLNDICQVGDLHKWAVGDNGTILYHTNNYPPVAMDDMASVRQDSSVKIFVLANDTDLDFHPLEIYSWQSGNHGVVTHPDNADYLEFFPDDDYTGYDTLQYVVSDNHGGYDTAYVFVEIREAPRGPFKQLQISGIDVAFGNATWADIDGDDDYDILVCGEQSGGTKVTQLFRNDEGAFVQTPDVLEGVRPNNDHAMAFTDLNGNGYLDFIITGENNDGQPFTGLYIYDTNLSKYVPFATDIPGVSNGSVDWGDVDHDGDPDLLISGTNGSGKICKIYKNKGKSELYRTWNFSSINANFHGLDRGAARFIDFNHDMHMDVLTTGFDAEEIARCYYYTNAEGMFIVGALDGYANSTIDFSDYNADGAWDILLTGTMDDPEPHTTLLTHNGVFEDTGLLLDGVKLGSAAWGDYDNDGDPDLVICGLNDQLAAITQLYVNNDGMLEPSEFFLPGMASGTVEWGDYDADGDLDILMSGYFNTEPNRQTIILTNELNTENHLPQAPSGLTVEQRDDKIKLIWTAGSDTETPALALRYNFKIKKKKYYKWQILPASNDPLISEIPDYSNAPDTSVLINGLESGALYECMVQSIDAGYQVSPWETFKFNVPSNFFMEQDVTFSGTEISAAEWFRPENKSIPVLLAVHLDHSHAHLIQWNGTGFDTVSADFVPGSSHGQLALLDFNNDNLIDFSEYSRTDSTMKLYINGLGTIAVKVGLLKPCYDWGDYDRDGDPDLIITGNISATSQLTKLYRNVNGELIFYNTLIPGVQYGDIAWVDFDGDGDDDVAITGYNENLLSITRVYENRNGGFVDTEMDLPGLTFSSFDFSDYDGDGDMDMLLCGMREDGTPMTMIYDNNGGVYTKAPHALTPIMQGTCKWIDLYTDGTDDIVLLGNTENEISGGKYTGIVYAHHANEYVEVAKMEQMPGPIIATGDYDGDKRTDLAFAGSSGGASRIYLYRNEIIKGGGKPWPPKDLSVMVYGDSAMLTWNAPSGAHGSEGRLMYNLRVGTSEGGSDLLSPLSYNSGLRMVFHPGNVPAGQSRMLYNLSPDSTYYAAVQSVHPSYRGSSFTQEIVFNTVSGSLVHVAIYGSNKSLRNAAWVDIDSDGDPDLVMDHGGIIDSYENSNGSIDFSSYTRHAEGNIAAGLLLNDYDNDNDADILLLSSTDPSANSMLENQSGVYNSTPLDITGLYRANAAWGDLNNDGRSDLLIMGLEETSSGLSALLYAQQEGTFESMDHQLVPTYVGEIHLVDIDNDGDMDLVRCGFTEDVSAGPEDILLLINRNMGGAFDEVDHDLPGLNYGSLDFGDYDNDGDLDMLYTGADPFSGSPHSYICENTGGTFVKADSILPLCNASVKWFDYNNDGLLDIAASGYNDVSQNIGNPNAQMFSGLFMNQGGEFVRVATLATFKAPKIAIADYDGDGRQDLFIGGLRQNSDTLGILYRNMSSDQNIPPTAPVLRDPAVYPDSVVISWNRSFDVDGNNMLYYNLRIGTSPGAGDILSPLSHADGTRKVINMGNMQQSTSYAIRGLKPSTNYYAAVQVIDKGMAVSDWSEEKSFTTQSTGTTHEIDMSFDVMIYPVPTHEQVNVDVITPFEGKIDLEIIDLMGRSVFQATEWAKNGTFTFHITLTESGLYFARIRSGDRQVIQKIVVTD